MKILCDREALLSAISAVSAVVPARSAKPILQGVKLTATEDGAWLIATDLEVSIEHRVIGVKVDVPGSALLPAARFGAILRTSPDAELAVEVEDNQLTVTGLRSTFTLPMDDPALFPDAPAFTAETYHEVAAADLRKLIRRTIFATDAESTRYALGGVLFELGADSIACIATDGRRLAKATATASPNVVTMPEGMPVVPVKALKLIDRTLDEDGPPVHLAIVAKGGVAGAVLVRTERAVIWSRLVEGRFPKYQDVFPKGEPHLIRLGSDGFRSALEQVSIATSEDSRGVDFAFSADTLRLNATAADVGRSRVETSATYDGPPLEVTFDPRYLLDFLKVLPGDGEIVLELVDGKNGAVFKSGDDYTVVVMPLTRDR